MVGQRQRLKMWVYRVVQRGKSCQTRMALIFEVVESWVGEGRDMRIVGNMRPITVPKGIPARMPSGRESAVGVRGRVEVRSGEVKRERVR
jgi:hypothetical protein